MPIPMDIIIAKDMDLEQLREIIDSAEYDCGDYADLPGAFRVRLLEEGLEGKRLKDIPFHRLFRMLEESMERVLDKRQAEEEK